MLDKRALIVLDVHIYPLGFQPGLAQGHWSSSTLTSSNHVFCAQEHSHAGTGKGLPQLVGHTFISTPVSNIYSSPPLGLWVQSARTESHLLCLCCCLFSSNEIKTLKQFWLPCWLRAGSLVSTIKTLPTPRGHSDIVILLYGVSVVASPFCCHSSGLLRNIGLRIRCSTHIYT